MVFCCKFRDFSWNSAAGINALKVCRLLTPRRLHELHIDVSEGSITGFWPPPARSLANRRTIRGLEMEKEEEEDGETRDFGKLVSVGSVLGGANTTRLSSS